jgi:hypothetical protein
MYQCEQTRFSRHDRVDQLRTRCELSLPLENPKPRPAAVGSRRGFLNPRQNSIYPSCVSLRSTLDFGSLNKLPDSRVRGENEISVQRARRRFWASVLYQEFFASMTVLFAAINPSNSAAIFRRSALTVTWCRIARDLLAGGVNGE